MPKSIRVWLLNSRSGILVLTFLERYSMAVGAGDPQPLGFWLALGAGAGFLILLGNQLSQRAPGFSNAAIIGAIVLGLPLGVPFRLSRAFTYDLWKRILAMLLFVALAGGVVLLLEGWKRS